VFGENPSVFAGLFVKKASLGLLERSAVARSIIVDIVPARRWSLRDKILHRLRQLAHLPQVRRVAAANGGQRRHHHIFSGPLNASVTGCTTDATENGNMPEICEVDSTASEDEEEIILEVECRGWTTRTLWARLRSATGYGA
jgi:hypothetical protein